MSKLAIRHCRVAFSRCGHLPGDIVAILDSNGTAVVQYKYDAWGKPISKTGSMKDSLGTLNPFRYRGYVYDEETELYYLRSRYFNVQTARFINKDALIAIATSLFNLNQYVYCYNNPLRYSDPDGYNPDLEAQLDDNVEVAPTDEMIGGSSGNASTTGNGTGSTPVSVGGTPNGVGSPPGAGSLKVTQSLNGQYMIIDGTPNDSHIDIHHITEQCQAKKTGFSQVSIQGYGNKVAIPDYVHRKISGFYSSKPPLYEGLRVRDWLAGQSFEFQQEFGWKVIERIWREMFGE